MKQRTLPTVPEIASGQGHPKCIKMSLETTAFEIALVSSFSNSLRDPPGAIFLPFSATTTKRLTDGDLRG